MENAITQRRDDHVGQVEQESSVKTGLEKIPYRQQAKRARADLSAAERAQQSKAVCERLLGLPEVGAARVVACYLAHGDELDLGMFMQAFAANNDRPEVTTGGNSDALISGRHEPQKDSGEHELLDGYRKSLIVSGAPQVPVAPETADISQSAARIVALPVTLRGPKLAFVQVDITELAKPESLPRCLREPTRPLDAVPAELAGRVIDPADIDVVILPGLAFDTCRTRLGYGGGYYDAWLEEAYGLGAAGKTEKHGGSARHSASRAPSSRRPSLIGTCFDCQLLPPGVTLPREPHDIAMDAIVTPSGVVEG